MLENLMVILAGVCFVILFFAPTIIARRREHRNKSAILVLNILGFLFWPWVIALVWSLLVTHNKVLYKHRTELDDLEMLAKLREQGVLTKDEFDKKKAQLLRV